MATAVNEALTCPVCCEIYKEKTREPVLLPCCGHTFCRICLFSVESYGKFDCPSCRKPHLGAPVSDLPPNYALINLCEVSNKSETLDDNDGNCKAHSDRLGLWCSECKIAMCGMCYFQDPSHKDHEVILVKAVVKEHKQKIKRLSEQICKVVILSKVYSCIELLLSPLDDGVNLASAALVILKDAEQSSNIQSLLVLIKQLEDIVKQISVSSQNESSETDNDAVSLEGEDHLDSSENEASSQPSQDTLQRVIESNTSPIGAACNEKLGCIDLVKPSLKCSALSKADGRRARLNWEDDGIHLYALSDTLEEGCITIEMSLMQALIPHSKPKVFLDLAVRGRHLGRVLISLWGHLHRAQHFLTLCLGILGPSYRGSAFTSIQFKGQPGESVHGGSSLTDNETSSPAIREDLEWNDDYTGDMKRGVVAGWPSLMGFQGSSFVICVRDNPDMQFLCPFGAVESGLDIVQEAIQHDPVTDISIQEVGAIIPRYKQVNISSFHNDHDVQ